MTVLPNRIRDANRTPLRPGGDYVLYWMTAARRPGWNFALQRAAEHARSLGRPLVVFEALRCDYRWASDRLHRFVLQGMAANAAAFTRRRVLYYPFVERDRGAGRGLLEALARRACVVVTDEFPCFFLPRMLEAAAARLTVRLEAVDSNGLMPAGEVQRAYPTAYAFRRFLQGSLRPWLESFPEADPLRRLPLPVLEALPDGIERRWPPASSGLLAAGPATLAESPIDHRVAPAPIEGGFAAAERAMARFVDDRLDRYAELRNQPEAAVTSRLAPYLHFGHLSPHQIFDAIRRREGWALSDLSSSRRGAREGWWGLKPSIEGFLDQLVTWRELGYATCRHDPHYDRLDGLPDWARRTLLEHAWDPRPHRYDFETLEGAETHDPLWNAAQRQLVREGTIHNYVRMLWGKKILEWSRDPEAALETLIELNNKYALDGRNPNSYSGISWVLGRYDRPWYPERPIFGTVRYMSSENTVRKVRVRNYLLIYGP
jgi:deoxyribodipyrimidine photo-lyase